MFYTDDVKERCAQKLTTEKVTIPAGLVVIAVTIFNVLRLRGSESIDSDTKPTWF